MSPPLRSVATSSMCSDPPLDRGAPVEDSSADLHERWPHSLLAPIVKRPRFDSEDRRGCFPVQEIELVSKPADPVCCSRFAASGAGHLFSRSIQHGYLPESGSLKTRSVRALMRAAGARPLQRISRILLFCSHPPERHPSGGRVAQGTQHSHQRALTEAAHGHPGAHDRSRASRIAIYRLWPSRRDLARARTPRRRARTWPPVEANAHLRSSCGAGAIGWSTPGLSRFRPGGAPGRACASYSKRAVESSSVSGSHRHPYA